MNIKGLFIVIISVFLFSNCSNGTLDQVITYREPTISFTDKVDSVVAKSMNQYNIPGLSIGIIKADSIIYTRGYGVKSINSKKAVTENSVFHTASLSKIFTALAIINLFKKRQLAHDDKLISVLPDLRYEDKRVESITIKSLLNHTSGIPDIKNYNWSYSNQAGSSLKNYILNQNLKLEFEPGSSFKYSSLGYDILGYVVEAVSGQAFEDYVKTNILMPSDMRESDFRYFKITDSLKTFPHSKSWFSKKVYQRKTYPYTREHSPSSTLNSSSNELSKWMISFIEDLHNEKEPYLLNSMTKESTNLNHFIGLGFQLYSVDDKKAIGHYGGDKGFRSYLLIVPDKKIGLVILANCDYNEDFRQEIIHPILSML